MLKFVILFATVACVWGAAVPEGLLPQLDGRIVGGKATTIENFPWQVSLLRSGSHFCGGSVIAPNLILTAAHCLQNAKVSTLAIRAGSTLWKTGGSVISVAAFKNHEGYNSRTMMNDIALIRLSSSLSMSNTIKEIALADETPENGAAAAVSGWGTTKSGSSSSPSELQYIETKIVSLDNCQSYTYGYGSEVKATMICAATDGKDSCQGDSGGPMVSGNRLVGVVSWGYGCASPNYPGVYSDVAALRSWVLETAETL